jgi:hypothetical protein
MSALAGAPLDSFSVDQRLSWAEKRHTTREEDKAYSLLGLFGVFMFLNYGEGKNNAFKRLRKAIEEEAEDLVQQDSALATHDQPATSSASGMSYTNDRTSLIFPLAISTNTCIHSLLPHTVPQEQILRWKTT